MLSILTALAIFGLAGGFLYVEEALTASWRWRGPRYLGSAPETPEPIQLPCAGRWLYDAHHPEREALGDRLLAALRVENATQLRCRGTISFDEYTLCLKALPAQRPVVRGNKKTEESIKWGWIRRGEQNLPGQPRGQDFLLHSFGVRDRDKFSEFLSNRFSVPSVLYDCFFDGDIGPMVTKNLFNSRADDATRGPCPDYNERECYGAPYEVRRECLGVADGLRNLSLHVRSFRSLSSVLRGRAPLSVFLKLDIEGSEWEVLDQLLSDEELMGKIRTINMEAHMIMYSGAPMPRNGKYSEKNFPLERKVAVMERLAEKFAVVGSTVGPKHKAMGFDIGEKCKEDGSFVMREPKVYPTGGLNMGQYALSLVNRAVL